MLENDMGLTVQEKTVIEDMLIAESAEHSAENEIDGLVIESFVKKFNEKYDNTLLQEQKTLLNLYIKSFVDNSLEFKVYLNEEIGRLKTSLVDAKKMKNISSDEVLIEKLDQVYSVLDETKNTAIDTRTLEIVLNAQQLLEDLEENDD